MNMTRTARNARLFENFKRFKYGIPWTPLMSTKGDPIAPRPDVFIERDILRNYEARRCIPKNQLKSWEEHFKTFVSLIWDTPNTRYRFTWNPYADRILENIRGHRFLGVSGHASSGKSQFGAIWAIANFLIDPEHTKVLVTSTSLQESRMRIWGVIEKYWTEAENYFTSLGLGGQMPGKLVTSSGKIVGNMNGKSDDLIGLSLIAGGKGNDGDASTKIGFKAGKLILVADELPLLTHKLYDAATNLLSNDGFQMLATGNLTSVFDPFGLFTEPENGWSTITEDDMEWRTKIGGYCIRFDGEKSPNVIAGRELYKGLLTQTGLDEIRAKFGERSPGFYRMVKSFPCPTGAIDTIYSEPELVSRLCCKGDTPWLRKPTPLAFLDPSFSKGGDAAAASFGLLGDAQINGVTIQVLEKTETIDLMMRVEAQHKTKDRNEQLADLYIAECERRGIAIKDRGVDATGGGDPFATILAMKMGHGFQLVSFAGGASDMPVSATDKRKGRDRFGNRVSELWYVGKEFVASGQIRGLDPATMREMCDRTYKELGNKVYVEPKSDMKKRTNGRSPDRADSWVGLIEVARRNYRFTAAAKAKVQPPPRAKASDWFSEFETPKRPDFREQFVVGGGFHSQQQSSWGEGLDSSPNIF